MKRSPANTWRFKQYLGTSEILDPWQWNDATRGPPVWWPGFFKENSKEILYI